MSVNDLKKYTKDCVAVITVHFNGQPCEMEKIVPWARKRDDCNRGLRANLRRRL